MLWLEVLDRVKVGEVDCGGAEARSLEDPFGWEELHFMHAHMCLRMHDGMDSTRMKSQSCSPVFWLGGGASSPYSWR